VDLLECINNRKVTRAYQQTPVPKELFTKILDAAKNCASTENMQAWEFAVFGGKVMEEVRKAYQDRTNSGSAPCPDIPYEPSKWPESFQYRRLGGGGPNMLTVLNIDPEDSQEMERLWYQAMSFWGAPYGIIIYTQRDLPSLSFYDVGGVLQTILLLAHNYGLGACPLLTMVFYPDIIRKILDIPSSKVLHIGIGIGYPDEKAVINTLKAFRLPLESMVTWHDL